MASAIVCNEAGSSRSGVAKRSFSFLTYLTDAMSFSRESQEVPKVLFRVK